MCMYMVCKWRIFVRGRIGGGDEIHGNRVRMGIIMPGTGWRWGQNDGDGKGMGKSCPNAAL